MSGNVKYCTDQSSFNIIVHNELIKNIIQITTNETNWALQVASLPFDYEITIKNKMVMNDKHPFVIVHQYHRSKPLTDFFENVFFKKNLI